MQGTTGRPGCKLIRLLITCVDQELTLCAVACLSWTNWTFTLKTRYLTQKSGTGESRTCSVGQNQETLPVDNSSTFPWVPRNQVALNDRTPGSVSV